jgi:hypothetical protein
MSRLRARWAGQEGRRILGFDREQQDFGWKLLRPQAYVAMILGLLTRAGELAAPPLEVRLVT